MSIESFDVKTDIDIVEWKSRAVAEATLIYNKPSTRRNRSLDDIIETCLYGHAPEQYLIENGFSDNPEMYKDLVNDKGQDIEIKVTKHINNIRYVLERCVEAKKQTWRNYPDIVYIYINDRVSSVYNLNGIYKWNGNSFI